jgi:hypothetical protein
MGGLGDGGKRKRENGKRQNGEAGWVGVILKMWYYVVLSGAFRL